VSELRLHQGWGSCPGAGKSAPTKPPEQVTPYCSMLVWREAERAAHWGNGKEGEVKQLEFSWHEARRLKDVVILFAANRGMP